MIKRNLVVVIGAVLLSSLIITGCYIRKKSDYNDLSTKIMSSKISTNDDKGTNRNYINLITPHLEVIGTNWRTFRKTCSKGSDEICSYSNSKTIIASLEDVKNQWEDIFSIDTKETKEIKELKQQLKKAKDLHIDSIENFLNGFIDFDPVFIKKGIDSFNNSIEIFSTAITPMIDKMVK